MVAGWLRQRKRKKTLEESLGDPLTALLGQRSITVRLTGNDLIERTPESESTSSSGPLKTDIDENDPVGSQSPSAEQSEQTTPKPMEVKLDIAMDSSLQKEPATAACTQVALEVDREAAVMDDTSIDGSQAEDDHQEDPFEPQTDNSVSVPKIQPVASLETAPCTATIKESPETSEPLEQQCASAHTTTTLELPAASSNLAQQV